MSEEAHWFFSDMQYTLCGAPYPDQPDCHCARPRGHGGKCKAAIHVEWDRQAESRPPDLGIGVQDDIHVSDGLPSAPQEGLGGGE